MESIKFQYCSDLHLEFPENKKWMDENPLEKHGDILILAGDIVPFSQIDEHKDFFNVLSNQFEFTYWIPGNHEYYYADLNTRNGSFTESICPNVFLLNNSMVTHGKASLIFSTLWTHITKPKADLIENRLSDFFVISNGAGKLRVSDYNRMHEESVQFLKNAIEYSQEQKTMVITHHVPTLVNYPTKFVNSPITQAFAVELKDLIKDYQPDYWIYGHSHVNVPPFTMGKTQLHTNQLGYIRYHEQTNYRDKAFIEI
jgi:predicted phosphohydrolase